MILLEKMGTDLFKEGIPIAIGAKVINSIKLMTIFFTDIGRGRGAFLKKYDV